MSFSGSQRSYFGEYLIDTLADGFQIVGPHIADDDETGGLPLIYRTPINASLSEVFVSDTFLGSNGFVFGAGAQAQVTETFYSHDGFVPAGMPKDMMSDWLW